MPAKIKISAKLASELVGYGSGVGDELPEAEKRTAWRSIATQISENGLTKTGGTLALNADALNELADWADYEVEMADLDQHDYNAMALGAYKAMMRGLYSRCCKALGAIEGVR